MHRNYKAGIQSNNRIRYNKITNSKTNNIYIMNHNEEDELKINTDRFFNINKLTSSNKKNKEFLSKNNKYKITNDDYYIY